MLITIGSKVKDGNGNEYELIEEIGQGGFGCVFKANRINDNQKFAIKTLIPSFANEDAKTCFMNEINLAKEINGENIIHYEFFHNGEQYPELPPYIIMELANNGTLRDIIEERKKLNQYFTIDELCSIYKQLISGMNIINKTLVHRDIKPENILINGNVLKITDFGLAKVSEEQTRTKTLKGSGTYLYMSPECWNDDKNTIQMDIYSMGIIFYELATLEYPYNITKKEYEVFKTAHLYSPIANAKKLQQNTNPQISSIIIKMLDKARQRRFNSWEEILEQFNSQLQEENVLNSLVKKTISIKNDVDIETQRKIEAENKKKKEIEDFTNLVKFQFESEIINPIKDYVEQYNLQSSTSDKANLIQKKLYNSSKFEYEVRIPTITNITIKGKVILKNSFEKEVSDDFYFDFEEYSTRKVNYTPKIKSKDVMAFIEIENNQEYGFNLVLCASDDLYGNWYIIHNKNNLSHLDPSKIVKEPFAFAVDNLEGLLRCIECTSLYSSKLEEYTQALYLENLSSLISNKN